MPKIASMLFSAVLLLSAVGSAAADIKDDVTSAYKAWDAAFNKGDAATRSGSVELRRC